MRKEEASRHKVHCFICNKGRACTARGAQKLIEEVKGALREKFPRETLRVNQSGCLGACEEGINAVIYQGSKEPIWLHELTSEDSEVVVKEVLTQIDSGE